MQVLGGTAQRGDTDRTPRQEDRDHIWQGCLKLMPSLAQAKVCLASWTCRLLLLPAAAHLVGFTHLSVCKRLYEKYM